MEVPTWAIAILAILLIALIVVWVRLRRYFRLEGIGFLSISNISVSIPYKNGVDLGFLNFVQNWLLGDSLGPLGTALLLLKARCQCERVKIRWDGTTKKFIFSMQRAILLLRISENPQPTKSPSSPLPFKKKFLHFLFKAIYRTIEKVLTVSIQEVEAVFTHFSEESTSGPDFWNAIGLRLQGISLFSSPGVPTCIESLIVEEHAYANADGTRFMHRPIIEIKNFKTFEKTANSIQSLLGLVTIEDLAIDLWPSTLLFFTSCFAGSGDTEENVSPQTNDKIKPPNIPAWGAEINLESLRVSLHLPIANKEVEQFESIILYSNNFRAFISMNCQVKFTLLFNEARIAARNFPTIAKELVSDVARLYGYEELLSDREETVLTINHCTFGNCLHLDYSLTDFISDVSSVAIVRAVLEGKPKWKVSQGIDGMLMDRTSKSLKLGTSLWDYIQKYDTLFLNTFVENFLLPDSITLFVRATRVAFEVPYEFPLSILFDHLTYFIKVAQAPLHKTNDRQDFYLFDKKWQLVMQTDEALFSLADSPLEIDISKSLLAKKSLFDRFDRLEKIFWSRCQEDSKVLGGNQQFGWVPPELRPLANSSSCPDILRGNLRLTKLYSSFQEVLFQMYKTRVLQGHDAQSPPPSLFAVQGQAVHFSIGWDPKFLDGYTMSDLLGAIEADTSFTKQEIGEFGVFLGGLTDISITKLSVRFRDYIVPLCKSDVGRLLGLVFLIEEPSYKEARSIIEVPVLRWGSMCGTSNLKGLDHSFRAKVSQTILPMKIYHSAFLNLFGLAKENVVGGFSPLFEGVFQMLDRAFELFSKPSEEPSPSLPFWDKLRLLFRGACSTIVISSSCRVTCLTGNQLNSLEDHISVLFPHGLSLGLVNGSISVDIPESIVAVKSSQWTLLNWLHQTLGESFSKAEEGLLTAAGVRLETGELPIVIFPKLRFELLMQFSGLNGLPVVQHNQVKICARSRMTNPPEDNFDSYRYFRIHRLEMTLRIISASGTEGKLLGFYYREIEGFIVKGFCRYITPPVMSGKIFRFGTLLKNSSPKLSSVLTDLQIHFSYDGLFCVRGLQYYDSFSFGGAVLRSKGRTRLHLAWRKSEFKQPINSNNYGRWFLHFAEYDFSRLKIGILDRELGEQDGLGRMKAALQYPGVAIYEILRAPRLFYIVVDEGCFKHDPDATSSQRKILEMHVATLAEEIDNLARKLRQTDPDKNLYEFSSLKRQVSVLLEQNDYYSKFLKSKEDITDMGKPQASNHHIIIQNAILQWHQNVRDAVFALIDQQFQYFRCGHALRWSAVRELEVEERRHSVSPDTQFPSRKLSSPMSPSGNGSAAEEIFEQLIRQQMPFDAGCEEPAMETLNISKQLLLCDPDSLHGEIGFISKRVDVSFVAPQIIFLDNAEDSNSAILVTASSAVLHYATIRQSEFGEMAGRRTKIVLNDALVHGAFRDGFKSWPPIYPSEYLLSPETESQRFQRIGDKLTVTFVYDVSNKRIKSTHQTVSSPIRRIFGKGDNLRVQVEQLNLQTNSELYTILYNVIVRLLVYRDPTQVMRSEQLESLALATNIFNQAAITRNIWKMRSTVLQRKVFIEGKISRSMSLMRGGELTLNLFKEFFQLKEPWDEIALVVDAMHTVKETQERLKQKQTQLVLDISIGSIKWTILKSIESPIGDFSLEGIHDKWLSAEDGCQSNLIEIKAIKAINRLPDAFYKTLIAPVPETIKELMHSETGYRGIGTQGNAIRFFFKARPPVGGLTIVEHCELNLSPLQFQLTYDIGEELFKFFFPVKVETSKKESTLKLPSSGNSKENLSDGESLRSSRSLSNLSELALGSDYEDFERKGILKTVKSSIRNTASSFLARFTDKIGDTDVEVMKTRAAENVSFVYIIVPASQHLISYKGRGESSITDVESFLLKLPDFEYHSLVISWLEFLLKLRKDAIRIVLSNIGSLVKEKIKRLGQSNVPESEDTTGLALSRAASRLSSSRTTAAAQSKDTDEEKIRMLLGRGLKK